MDKHQIGLNAGVVWHLLNNNNRWTYTLIFNYRMELEQVSATIV